MKSLIKRHFSTMPFRLPAILSDVDGVVYRGGQKVGNSNKVLAALLNQKIEGKYKIPFALLTNGGGIPE